MKIGITKNGGITPITKRDGKFYAQIINSGQGGSDTFWAQINEKKYIELLTNKDNSKIEEYHELLLDEM